MPLDKELDSYFQAWIGVSTWHTGHPCDLKRFYNFVWAVRRFAYWKDGRPKKTKKAPSDVEIHEAIVHARKDSFDHETLECEAMRYQNLYSHLLDFALLPNTPNPLVEKKHIRACFWALGGHMADPRTIKAFMTPIWGN